MIDKRIEQDGLIIGTIAVDFIYQSIWWSRRRRISFLFDHPHRILFLLICAAIDTVSNHVPGYYYYSGQSKQDMIVIRRPYLLYLGALDVSFDTQMNSWNSSAILFDITPHCLLMQNPIAAGLFFLFLPGTDDYLPRKCAVWERPPGRH